MSEQGPQLTPAAIADDELILGWRDSEWTGIAPFLEEDVAFSSIAQNEIGHARALYELAAAELGTTPTSSRSTASPTSTAARRSSSCASSRTGRARSRATCSTRRPTSCGSSAEGARTTPRSPASRRRSTARRSTTACTRRCGPTGSRDEPRFGEAVDGAVARTRSDFVDTPGARAGGSLGRRSASTSDR